MAAKRAAMWLAPLAMAALASCVFDATETLVVVGTNLPTNVPLRLRVTTRRGAVTLAPGTPADQEWTRAAADAGVRADAGIQLPASFAIVPPAGGPSDSLVTLVVEGVTPYDTLRRIVHFRLDPHQTTTLRVFLAAECLAPDTRCRTAVNCTRQQYCEENGQTCGNDGNCTSISQTPGSDGGFTDVTCVPYCAHANCGDPDGCGGTCQTGTCGGNGICQNGTCVCGAGEARCGATCMPSASIACQPGETGMQPCGMCGTQSRTCGATCQWGAWGACTGEGVCNAGATRSQACGNCGSQSATCGSNCQWGNWGTCTGQGCSPGSTQRGGCDPCSHQTCTSSCTWSACGLNAGAQCEYQSGTHHRSCGACACGLQYCLSSCVWSTGCVSFCGGTNSGACYSSCAGGC